MGNLLIRSIVKRVSSSVVVLFLVISFVFILIRLSPGDPVQKFISPTTSPELAKVVRKTYSLNEPLYKQYISFVSNFIKGNLGYSYNFRLPVLKVVFTYAQFTIIFSFIGFILRLLFGFILAYISFNNIGSWFDKLIRKVNLTFYASPAFIIGVFLVLSLSVGLHLFPSSGLLSFNYDEMNFFQRIGDYLSHLTLPMLTLVLSGMPLYYLYLRESLENENQKDYITYLRSNGVSKKTIFYKHILPNTISPLLAVAGIELGFLLGGTLLVEVVFGLPGMGRLTIDAISLRDYPLIIGCCLFSGFMMLASTMIADIARLLIDRRLIKGIMN